jgi:hypothetical protein
MKKSNPTPNSFTGRTFMYLSTFVAGSALHELLVQVIHPTIWSTGARLLTLLTLVIFILAGALLACERHTMSRVTSAATLFILGLIALRIGHSVVPDPYLLIAAFVIAAIGAQPLFHRKLADVKRTVLYSLLVLFVVIVITITLTYGLTVLDRIVTAEQYDYQAN